MSLIIVLLILGLFYKEIIIMYLKYILFICKVNSLYVGKSIVLVNIIYGFVLLFLCMYYVYKVRNIFENFNEVKWIGFVMYILFLFVLVYYLVVFVFDGWYIIVFECVINIISVLGFFFCIFVFRIYIILFKLG